MKILVVGSGAREHAICWKLAREIAVKEIVCTPGNPGIGGIARCVPGDVSAPSQLLEAAARERVDLTVIGPELPLSLGVVDAFVAQGRAIVGPTQSAAALESSKVFAKQFMARHQIPTARFRVCETEPEALNAIASEELGWPLVIKADGLAAGKGVVLVDDREAALAAVHAMMVNRQFGAAGDRVVLEEFLVGQEASYFALVAGSECVLLSSAQDHKRIFDDDRGPNTGGMGAFSPSPLVTEAVEQQVIDEIVRPVLAGMQQEGRPYSGFLYVGLMLTAAGPKVVEFNVRFGDPEAQVVLPMLDEDLSWLLAAAATGVLPTRKARFTDEPHVGVVLASRGYPGHPETGQPLEGLDAAAKVPGALLFHAGTSKRNGRVATAGGRVLTVVGKGASYQDAIDVAYRAAEQIRFDGMQFRRDIGRKALPPS